MVKNIITLSKINKYFRKNKISTLEVKKYLKKKGFIVKITKQNEENNFGAISRTFLSSLIIVSIFSIIPLAINFTKDKIILSNVHENNSKNKLNSLLENKNTSQILDDGVDKEFLFDDILNFGELPTDTVRLSAATIVELFKSTDYNLKDVRKKN